MICRLPRLLMQCKNYFHGQPARTLVIGVIEFLAIKLEIVMNELRKFKHSADFLANNSHIIESAAISLHNRQPH